MSRLFQECSPKTKEKWHDISRLTAEAMLERQANSAHSNIWRVVEIASIASDVNAMEEIFYSYQDGSRVMREFKPTRGFMRKMVNASMTNGGNTVFDLNYDSPRFGECGYVVRVNERVPYGLIKHMNAVPAGCAKRSFELIFNLGDKLGSVDVAAEELCRIPSIDPYLTVLLAMFYLKRGDHGFEKDIKESMMMTLRLLENGIASHREGETYYDALGELVLLPDSTTIT